MSAQSDSNIHPEPTPPASPNPLLTLSQISESNVSKLIWSSPSKSCDLDPCPTQIVKDSADILAGVLSIVIVRCSTMLCVESTSFYYVYYSSQFNKNSFWS